MNRVFICLIGILAAALIASDGFTQQPKDKKGDKAKNVDPFVGSVSLLKQKDVQKELKLTVKQVQQVQGLDKAVAAKIKDDSEKFFKSFTDPNERFKQSLLLVTNRERAVTRRQVEEQLVIRQMQTDTQQTRFTEIRWQVQGPLLTILARGFAQKDLEPEFVKAMELTEKQKGDTLSLLDATENLAEPPEWKNVQAKFMALLTDAQKAKWKAATGEPFQQP